MFHALTGIYEWGNRLMWLAAAVSIPFWIYVALYAAPQTQRLARQQQQQATAREDRTFCEKYRMPAGTPEYGQCVKDLTDVRARNERRLAAEMEGVF
jgi:hypothetical protein